MLQRLLSGYTLSWIIYKDLLQEVKEISAEITIIRDNFLPKCQLELMKLGV